MPQYAIRFSTTTGKSTVHAPSCKHATSRSGHVTAFIEAPSAQAAANRANLGGELTARGFPFPRLCQCVTLLGTTPHRTAPVS